VIHGQHYRSAGIRFDDPGKPILHSPVKVIAPFEMEAAYCRLRPSHVPCLTQIVYVRHVRQVLVIIDLKR
jgi:hypothetical protein